jgi:hypothetical protein
MLARYAHDAKRQLCEDVVAVAGSDASIQLDRLFSSP